MKSVNVSISGRNYPVRISDGEEEYIKSVVDNINDEIRELQLKYTSKDKQDCLTMALLMYAMRLKKSEDDLENGLLTHQLNEMDALLSEHIKG